MEKAAPSRKSRALDSPETPRRPRLFLFVSLGLNLGLLIFLAVAWRKSTPQSAPAIPLPDTAPHASERTSPAKSNPVAASAAPLATWQQFESTNLMVYAANLRTAGCPEKTVRDILLPLLEEKFDVLELSDSEPTNFWANFSERRAATIARSTRQTALEQEKDKALKELFGFAWTSAGLKRAYEPEAAFEFGFLDYDRAEKMFCVIDRFDRQFARTGFSRYSDRRLAIYTAWRGEVNEVLSPAEFEETALRKILSLYQNRNPHLADVALSGAELRQLMIFRREQRDPFSSAVMLAGNDGDRVAPDAASEQPFLAKARTLLGDRRFIGFLENCDPGIGRTLATLEKEHLPQGLVLPLFDLRQGALARAQEIRRQSEHRTEKRAQLVALRRNALEQLAALPNTGNDGVLLRINQDWLQEIASP